ncbi:MAG: ABC transporter ATP-binding protein [Acidobacteriota bacterium]
MNEAERIVLIGVSKFYGEVLGVNNVDLTIGPGLTGLVGPNGAGKSTLMNLLTGLIKPTKGSVRILGISPGSPELLFRKVGLCSQWDSFPPGATGLALLEATLMMHGLARRTARERALEALETVGLTAAAGRKVDGYSKGMKQRVKLANALCHNPQVLFLDEPLNGLDPQGRSEMIDILKERAGRGHHVLVSSHILHEVDLISDTIIMMHGGRVVAEGAIRDVRQEIVDRPVQILIRCDRPERVAARAFEMAHVVAAQILDQGGGLIVSTRDGQSFFSNLPRIVVDEGLAVETVVPADEDVRAVYDYLIGPEGGQG